MIGMKLASIEKDKQPSQEILRLFERTRVAYLSAIHDPTEYSGRWRKAVDTITEAYSETDTAGKEMRNFIEEKELEDKDVKDPSSRQAKELFEKIKLLRYSSSVVADPFASMFKDSVLEELLDNPESMVKFVHYALRNDNKALSDDIYSVKGMQPDTITEGLMGLDLESDDIALYIIEHYGDGKDSKKVESKVKAAMDMLELIFFSKNDEKDWGELKDIEGVEKSVPSDEKKSISQFIVPNKPMYRIFEVDDIKELRGFSGDWYVQEKFDGMRIQLHKLDDKVKVYSYNEKDITDKCKEQVKELKKKEYGDCILDAELVLFDGEDPLHRADTIAHVFKEKYKDSTLRCHVFDIIRHEAQTLVDEELENRMTILFNNYSAKSGEAIAYPSKKDTRQADNLKDIEKYAEEIMKNPASEGVVIKDATSTYYVGTKKNPKWIKLKKFVDLDVIVLDKKKTKSNLYSYTVGVGPIPDDMDGQEIEGRKYLNVGKALNTKESVGIGEILRVKVDEVKKKGEGFSLFSAKVIEIPEVEYPDKLITLELLSQDTKKSLNYSVEAFTKGVKITDHIHGETNAILKFDLDGFTLYGYEEDNLMSKNATLDIDLWKQQAIEIMKSKQSDLTVAMFQYLKRDGDKTPKQLHNFLKEKYPNLYEDVLESDEKKLKRWSILRDGISEKDDKISADDDKIMQEEDIKKSIKPMMAQQLKVKQRMNNPTMRVEEKPNVNQNVAVVEMDAVSGDCCEQMKRELIEETRETYESILENSGNSWNEVVNEITVGFGNTVVYADTMEEEIEDYANFLNEMSCEEVLEFLENIISDGGDAPDEEYIAIRDQYKSCSSFGSGFSDKYAMLKEDIKAVDGEYKTPPELREGVFKLYAREDDNLTLAIKLKTENMFWTINIENEKEMFDLFGAAGKYPAEVAKNVPKGKVVDSGKIRLGIQRDGYHEYFLEGNKFETKMHYRVLKVNGEQMWLAWTGFKQTPADKDGDEGKWNIYEDRYNKLPLPTEE